MFRPTSPDEVLLVNLNRSLRALVAADRGRVPLRYGPLIYCIESMDQNVDSVLSPDAPLATEWRRDLFGGVMVIRGKFADGKPMLAIPYYARADRGGRYAVWIRDK